MWVVLSGCWSEGILAGMGIVSVRIDGISARYGRFDDGTGEVGL